MPLRLIKNDATKMCVDAIVSTANDITIGNSEIGFDPQQSIDSPMLASIPIGSAAITKANGSASEYTIQTACPVWKGGHSGESLMLRSCYWECLKLAVANGCQTIAFPLISSGEYGYPKDHVLKLAVNTISEFLFENELTVYLCVSEKGSYEFDKELYNVISELIEDDFAESRCVEEAPQIAPAKRRLFSKNALSAPQAKGLRSDEGSAASHSLREYMKSMDKSFAYKLFELIDERGMTDVECYKKANVDKKTFSKIKCNPQSYRPSKQTAVAFAIALRLSLDETQKLLACAGLTLSQSFTFDKIISFFIKNGIYDVFEINEALFEFDQVLLGL